MGLRCSLLGHDFGDPEVEREREERGSEVVLTVREVAECSRCSKTNVVSENKEVTTLHDAGEADDESTADELDAEIDDADASSAPSDDEADASDEDAVIIEDEETDDDGRAHGEWPEPDEDDEDDAEDDDAPMEWPSVDTDDEGFDARPSAGGDAAVEFGGGLAPERATVEEEEGLEYVESAEPAAPGDAGESAGEQADADGGFARVGAAPSPSEPATADVDAEFVCPQCGFVDDVVGSSLRAGDVCPDCRKGYLAERDR